MKALKKGVEILLSVVLWAVILLAALFAFTTLATRDQNSVSSIAGFTPMIVESDSMAPTFKMGDMIIIKKCDTSKLKEGDIITFHTIINNEYALNTHRIESIQEVGDYRSYTTKGDNNQVSDTHIISDGDIVGQYVTKISGLGKVMSFLSSSMGFLIVIVLPLLLFFIYQVYHLVMVSINLKKAMAAEDAKEQELAKIQAENEVAQAEAAKAEAQAALEEAMRLKAEAEAKLAEAKNMQEAAEDKKEEDK